MIRLRLLTSALVLLAPAALRAQGAFPPDPSEKQSPMVEETVPPSAIPKPNAEATPEPTSGQETAAVPTRSFEVESGDNLTIIAAKAYGSAGYWRILKLHNEVDPSKLKVGQTLEAPDLMALLRASGVVPLFDMAVADLMRGRSLFSEVEATLTGPEGSSDSQALGDAEVAKLEEAKRRITACMEALGDRREGVTGVPTSTIQQLRTAATRIEEIAAGDTAASTLTEVHERLGNAITYAVLWGRDGFK